MRSTTFYPTTVSVVIASLVMKFACLFAICAVGMAQDKNSIVLDDIPLQIGDPKVEVLAKFSRNHDVVEIANGYVIYATAPLRDVGFVQFKSERLKYASAERQSSKQSEAAQTLGGLFDAFHGITNERVTSAQILAKERIVRISGADHRQRTIRIQFPDNPPRELEVKIDEIIGNPPGRPASLPRVQTWITEML